MYVLALVYYRSVISGDCSCICIYLCAPVCEGPPLFDPVTAYLC